ncbi:MAG: hypothetical protein H6577_26215 [Lewinellaceae bacterium]|nr:hypothetical protein [Saprospiraceae bacterium]MCB9341635.1 hypothetical protein [Lewinellaceae bacterium]
MMKVYIQLLLASIFLLAFSLPGATAQKAPECVKVAKANRPNWLLLKKADLDRFYLNFEGNVTFSNMKLVKSELAFYLIAKEQGGESVFAFELEQKGNKLFLNKYFPVQSCNPGELTLDTFIQQDGKITGCRTAKHSLQQIPEKSKKGGH